MCYHSTVFVLRFVRTIVQISNWYDLLMKTFIRRTTVKQDFIQKRIHFYQCDLRCYAAFPAFGAIQSRIRTTPFSIEDIFRRNLTGREN